MQTPARGFLLREYMVVRTCGPGLFMSTRSSSVNALLAPSLEELVTLTLQQAQGVTDNVYRPKPKLVVSPYRFNPLGAHIDHQGGSVLARCLDQYTLLYFWPQRDGKCRVHANIENSQWQHAEFTAGDIADQHGWDAMARGAVSAFHAEFFQVDEQLKGIDAVVFGTLVSGGLSSSASVVLAYLIALADVNDITLEARQLVELVRRVENEYRGLNNGVQDQMSIVFGQKHHLVQLDVEQVTATAVADPHTADEVVFLMCYSGVSRDLATGSNFNTRVAECREAAACLSAGARHLGEVPEARRTQAALSQLSDVAQRRASHVFSEMQRVDIGCAAWAAGDWHNFGQLMNDSCFSSINYYESGSPWLIDLHSMAKTIDGVYGSRFSGGGFGGCLFMLIEAEKAVTVADELMRQYLQKYPELADKARVCLAQSEGTVRVVSL